MVRSSMVIPSLLIGRPIMLCWFLHLVLTVCCFSGLSIMDTNSVIAFVEWNNHCGSNRSSTRAGQNAGWGSCTLYKLTQKTVRASSQQPCWCADSGNFLIVQSPIKLFLVYFMKYLFPLFSSTAGANWEVEGGNRRKEITYTFARAADGSITWN